MSDIEERMTEILARELRGNVPLAEHLSRVLAAELGLTQERAVGGPHGNEPLVTSPHDVSIISRFGWTRPLVRYVTPWTAL